MASQLHKHGSKTADLFGLFGGVQSCKEQTEKEEVYLLRFENKVKITDILVIPDSWTAMDIVLDLRQNISHFSPFQRKALDQLIVSMRTLMSSSLGRTHAVVHEIELSPGTNFIKQRFYPASPIQQKLIFWGNIIEPCKSAWISLTDSVDRLRSTIYLCSLDIKGAYWQVFVAGTLRDLTAFTAPGSSCLGKLLLAQVKIRCGQECSALYGLSCLDNEVRFESKEFQNLAENYGVRLVYNAVYHPQCNPTKKKARENFMEQDLNVEVDVMSVVKLGDRTCLIRLTNYTEKLKVMQNKNKLRLRAGEKLFIQDDLSKKDREIQQQIRMMAKKERENGKENGNDINKKTDQATQRAMIKGKMNKERNGDNKKILTVREEKEKKRARQKEKVIQMGSGTKRPLSERQLQDIADNLRDFSSDEHPYACSDEDSDFIPSSDDENCYSVIEFLSNNVIPGSDHEQSENGQNEQSSESCSECDDSNENSNFQNAASIAITWKQID
ncbi:hypothetical protein ILUMI_25008 [Ignelater luminosus]|uniref:Uncharacterized protein n=1 Tax=Ignelater luminosus TaxID=2038154 RepID=A0A8K0C652_IGNLU|nr:hypothetical protein ILUMI_25008 [Ignelater luminosus]